MRYRPLDANGDFTVLTPFLFDSVAAVAQAVRTNLNLFQGEWFLDVTNGLPFYQKIAGRQQTNTPDAYIKQRILATQGVVSILAYTSSITNRSFSVTATINTIYGTTTVTV